MVRGQRRSTLCLGAVGVNPCMQLHAASMTLLNHPLQRVPIRIGRQSLLSCQVTAPRLYQTWIESITFHTHLKEDGIDAVALKIVELTGKHSLHPVTTNVLKLSVNSLNPGTAELSLGVLSHCRNRCK